MSQEGQSEWLDTKGRTDFESYMKELRRTIIDVHRDAERTSEAGKINVPIKCITYMRYRVSIRDKMTNANVLNHPNLLFYFNLHDVRL